MKGLLLKEFYFLKNYFFDWIIFLIPVILLYPYIWNVLDFFKHRDIIPFFVNCIIQGFLFPLLFQSKNTEWKSFVAATPITKAQYVSTKYILSLIIYATVLLLFILSLAVAFSIKMLYLYNMNLDGISDLVLIYTVTFPIYIATLIPTHFYGGYERLNSYDTVIYGVINFFIAGFMSIGLGVMLKHNVVIGIIILIVLEVALYIVSWQISIKIYKYREF